MKTDETAPGADGVVLSLRERVDAGWVESFAMSGCGHPPRGTSEFYGVWVFRGAGPGGLIFSRWLVPA
jgi:hypothetical protein